MHLGYDNPHHASYFMDGIEERDLGVIMSEDVKWENSVLRQLSKVIKYLPTQSLRPWQQALVSRRVLRVSLLCIFFVNYGILITRVVSASKSLKERITLCVVRRTRRPTEKLTDLGNFLSLLRRGVGPTQYLSAVHLVTCRRNCDLIEVPVCPTFDFRLWRQMTL